MAEVAAAKALIERIRRQNTLDGPANTNIRFLLRQSLKM